MGHVCDELRVQGRRESERIVMYCNRRISKPRNSFADVFDRLTDTSEDHIARSSESELRGDSRVDLTKGLYRRDAVVSVDLAVVDTRDTGFDDVVFCEPTAAQEAPDTTHRSTLHAR